MDGMGARNVIDSARYVEQKLSHIKLACHITTKSCALIVTEKVGAHNASPNVLEAIFTGSEPSLARTVALQIAAQVEQLGDLLPESKPLKELLWRGHDITLITEQWNRFAPEVQKLLGEDPDPVALFSELMVSEKIQRITERSLVHGDLHMSNVALDLEPNVAHAYIFDAGVVNRNVAGRDIAVIEASVLLHQRIEHEDFVQICLILYGPARTETGDVASVSVVGVAKDIVEFILALREAAKPWNEAEIYALMVFDFVLIQIGGLAYGSFGNRIVNQPSAAYLLAMVAEWYRRLRSPTRALGDGAMQGSQRAQEVHGGHPLHEEAPEPVVGFQGLLGVVSLPSVQAREGG
jgi:hypothetical protein